MAGDGAPLIFVGLHNDHFYFDDFPHDEVDADVFEFSQMSKTLIRCPDDKFLILNEVKEFDLKDLNIQQQSCSDYKLAIRVYRDLSVRPVRGRVVMLYALKGDRKYAAVCKNENEVTAEEVHELQGRIEAAQHKALFYMILEHRPNRYKLRSTLYPDKALGFDQTDSNKLVLCPYDDPENQSNLFTLIK
ncbi:hypothetical protein NQD34_009308 [Periophthalmus magnuspinnatus]|nr:hypothetical protein NQD34_009308 [Periophthalmus magnuspinnatus]